jgi:hypothetical protein
MQPKIQKKEDDAAKEVVEGLTTFAKGFFSLARKATLALATGVSKVAKESTDAIKQLHAMHADKS